MVMVCGRHSIGRDKKTCPHGSDLILVVGIVTASAAASEAERNSAQLSHFSQHPDGRQFESTSAFAALTLHDSHTTTSRTTSNSVVVQSMTAAVSQSAGNTCPASTVTTSSSMDMVSSRHVPVTSRSSSVPTTTPADVSDLLFDDLLLPGLPPPLIPVPDRYQPLVDVVAATSTNDQRPSTNPNTPTHKSSIVRKPTSPLKSGECSVCMESEPNAALYPCGHMCMCYDCAVSVQKLRGALCPICRQPIIDILRIYRT